MFNPLGKCIHHALIIIIYIYPCRSDIEERKDADIEMIDLDIKKMKTEEAYRNKHGLHKKPPKEKPQQLEVELPELDDLDFLDTARPLKLPSPLRVDQQKEERYACGCNDSYNQELK